MAFILPFIAAVSGAVGIATGIKSLIGGGKQGQAPAREPAPEPKPLPKTPTVEDASKKAQEGAARRRRISLLSGGETNITRGKSLLSEGDVGRKTLLGT